MFEYIQSPQFQQLIADHPDFLFLSFLMVIGILFCLAYAVSGWFSIKNYHYHYHNYPLSDKSQENKQFDDSFPEKNHRFKTKKNRPAISPNKRFTILQRDGFRCQLCGRTANDKENLTLHIDHKIPFAKGGNSTEENLWTLCSECNNGKSDSIIQDIVDALQETKTAQKETDVGGGQ